MNEEGSCFILLFQMLRNWHYDISSKYGLLFVMTEQDVDFESLPSDIKDKLAELELELSEGKFIF